MSTDDFLPTGDEEVFFRVRYPGEECQNMALRKPLGYDLLVEGGYYEDGFYTFGSAFEGVRMRYAMEAEDLPSGNLQIATAHSDAGEILGRVVLVPRRVA